MTLEKNAKLLLQHLRHAYSLDNYSATIDTKGSHPVRFFGDTFSGILPEGRIVVQAVNYRALANREDDIKLRIVACPENIEFEISMYDKEFTIPSLEESKILSDSEIFKVGDIVSAEPSSNDHYGITSYRGGYIGRVLLTDSDGFNLGTYSRLGFDLGDSNTDGELENFSVSTRYFRLSSALEVLHGANTKVYLKTSYVGRTDGLAILPLKETRLSANGAVLGILPDGSEVSLVDNVAYFDRLSQGNLQETVKAEAAAHPLKGSGYLRARRLRHT